MCRMFVHTPFMKSCEWLMMTRILSYFARYASSHTHASRSRWFVGSSRSIMVGLTKSARASAMRMRQPPENSLVRRFCISFVKPRPCRMLAARASVSSAPSSSSLRGARGSGLSRGDPSCRVRVLLRWPAVRLWPCRVRRGRLQHRPPTATPTHHRPAPRRPSQQRLACPHTRQEHRPVSQS